MYSRFLSSDFTESCFLFGPRGVGKSSWVTSAFPKANYINLLEDTVYTTLLASPGRLEGMVADPKQPVILDEVQKVPAILDEVHRLIEVKKWRFILTGSSARKLRRGGANLLAGRALTKRMFPLTAAELKSDFSLIRALKYGTLPKGVLSKDPKAFLKSYVSTYLKEEIQAEGLTRNLAAFARFLEAASFSQGQPLNTSRVGADAHINQKVAESYFQILDDLMLARQLPVFTRRAKRKMAAHPKFYFFDVGVFNAIRPRGPLDSESEIRGISLESLVLQDFIAMNEYLGWEFTCYYWRTQSKLEVDFVFYGPRGLFAVEVKSGQHVTSSELKSLEAFQQDYPKASCFLVHGGQKSSVRNGIQLIAAEEWFARYPRMLAGT